MQEQYVHTAKSTVLHLVSPIDILVSPIDICTIRDEPPDIWQFIFFLLLLVVNTLKEQGGCLVVGL